MESFVWVAEPYSGWPEDIALINFCPIKKLSMNEMFQLVLEVDMILLIGASFLFIFLQSKKTNYRDELDSVKYFLRGC